jgi:hypothetical protein
MSDRTPTTAAGRALDHELYVVVSQSSGAQFHHRRAILAIEDEVRTQLHETHVCRECGAAITIPYVKPEARAPLDVERLVRALAAVDHRIAVEFPEEAVEMESHEAALGRRSYGEAVAREYAALEEPTP